MNPRIRRLIADHEEVTLWFSRHPYIRIASAEGNPPEKYVVQYRVRSLVPVKEGEPAVSDQHRAEIFLPVDYPRRSPFCRMLNPVFHPNIDPQKICIGDHWTAGQSLAELIIQIAQMLCYQSYNVKSPLNAEAAAWAEMHAMLLPLQAGNFTPKII